jgi:alpha-beta hydrolase superfamily lysophospholipase
MNEVNYISIKQKDGYITKLTHFICPKRPRASILILHGMAEHQKRYLAFADYLVENGFDVFTYNHRGHGTDKKLNELGFFAANNGDQLVINDAISVSNYIEQNNRCSKFFLLGHSMGSFIARNVIQSFEKYNGVILSGTAFPPKSLTRFGIYLSSLIKSFKGPKYKSPFMHNLLFGGKKYTRLSKRTAYDWLSRKNPVVGAYIHDPYCGFKCTTAFYNDLLKLIYNASKKKQIRLTKRELPLLIISGDKDPVGAYGKEVHKYLYALKKLGFTNVTSKIYPDCRHELLNELNSDEVFADVQQWIAKRI